MERLFEIIQFLYAHHAEILMVASVVAYIVVKIIDLFKKVKQAAHDKESAMKAVEQIMLELVSDAEKNWSEWKKSGAIKKSEVVKKVYVMYPILAKFADEDEFNEWLDKAIDVALEKMREVIGK